MIEINLLPEELHKKKMPYLNLDIEIEKLRVFIGGALVGALILLLIIFGIGSSVRKRQILNLMAKENKIATQKSLAETIDKEVSIFKVKMKTLDGITGRRFLWAKKLNELSDIVLSGIWLTRIYTDSDRLAIEGSVISKKEEAMASVGKFMENIREHSSFFKDFRNIKLETVQRKSAYEKDIKDIVDFRIALYF